MSVQFVFDSDALISAHRSYYRMQVWPQFWLWLEEMVNSGSVCSSRLVLDELRNGNEDDPLRMWAERLRDRGLFPEPSGGVQKAFARVVDHVRDAYEDDHAALFLSVADPWVISQALTTGVAVVTREKRKQSGAKRVTIPNVCDQFGVQCLNLFDVFDLTGTVFQGTWTTQG